MSGTAATTQGNCGGGGGGNGFQKRFNGEDPEKLRGWKARATAKLLSTPKKSDGTHDRSTWGPFLIELLDGEAAELFFEEDVEAEYGPSRGTLWSG